MKRSAFALLATAGFCLAHAAPARASDINVPPSMQVCSSDSDCMVVDGKCGMACSFVPLNKQYASAYDDKKQSVCGETPQIEAQCVTAPALNPVCVHNRCTIGAAWQEHADAKDYSDRDEAPAQPATQQKAMKPEYDSSYAAPSIRPRTAGQSYPYPDRSHSADIGGNSDTYTNPGFDDKHGFNAYDLPDQGASTTRTLGVEGVKRD
jgi:hypothetical protein